MTRMKTTIRRALVLGVCGLAITSAHAQEPTANNTAQNEAEADDGAVGEEEKPSRFPSPLGLLIMISIAVWLLALG